MEEHTVEVASHNIVDPFEDTERFKGWKNILLK